MADKKMVEAITSMEEDFAQWYTDVVKKAELCDYTSVKGCMVIKPAGYAIWELIQKELDARFKAVGVQNVYLPMFIPESLLDKEKDHVEGFAPEVAWVTQGGLNELPERLCVRPTSETLFCDFYKNDIHSYRDLPKVYNQWCSVVRWEKETRPFLRSREFLWQEGHTAHATAEESQERTLQSAYSIETTLSNETVAERSDILFLAVKPNKFDEVIPQISSHVKSGCVIVSIAAGKTIAAIEDSFGKPVKLVRAMPNTPALVGEAMSALCVNQNVTSEELKEVQALFNSFGKSEVISESLMDAVIGVSGSSPAYVYMFIEAMADAAVADGMPRAQAYKFAAQSVYGSAKMVLETGKHPGELKDAVCSPAGTTIEAVAALEAGGFRNTVISAQRACSQKSRDMSSK